MTILTLGNSNTGFFFGTGQTAPKQPAQSATQSSSQSTPQTQVTIQHIPIQIQKEEIEDIEEEPTEVIIKDL